jgi:hypothetical protein
METYSEWPNKYDFEFMNEGLSIKFVRAAFSPAYFLTYAHK